MLPIAKYAEQSYYVCDANTRKIFLSIISGFPYRVPLNASIKTNILNISNTPQQYTQCNK